MNQRTKWTNITQSTKKRVFDRDGGCIFCGSPYGLPEAHYISRAKGGSGSERNIITACRYTCHKKLDSGTKEERTRMREYAKNYLMSKYEDWNEEELIFKKGVNYE